MGLFNDVFGIISVKILTIAKSREWAQLVHSVEKQINNVTISIDNVLEMYKLNSPELTKKLIERVGRDISYHENQVFVLRRMNEMGKKSGLIIGSITRASDAHLKKALLNMLKRVEQFTVIALEIVPNWPDITERISKETKLEVATHFNLTGEQNWK